MFVWNLFFRWCEPTKCPVCWMHPPIVFKVSCRKDICLRCLLPYHVPGSIYRAHYQVLPSEQRQYLPRNNEWVLAKIRGCSIRFHYHDVVLSIVCNLYRHRILLYWGPNLLYYTPICSQLVLGERKSIYFPLHPHCYHKDWLPM